MGKEGLGILGVHKKKKCLHKDRTHYGVQRWLNSQTNRQNHHPKQLKSNVPRFQNKGKQFRVGQWKPSRRPWQNHINVSHRRSLCFAKYKTVSLQIYGNNVRGAKGCHFESKKAHFIVALMASDVKANYTPTCWERNQSQERNVHLETHPQEFGKPALLPSHANLSQAQTKDVFFPIKKWKGLVMRQWEESVSKLFWGQDFTPASMWGWEGGGATRLTA